MKIKYVYGDMKKSEIWTSDITYKEFKHAIMIVGPLTCALGINLIELTSLFSILNEMNHKGISSAVAGSQLRKALSKFYEEKNKA